MIKSLSLIIILLVQTRVFAQDHSRFIRHYTTEQGLANNHIKAIGMDRNGYVWMATEFGFCRFDGARFINYNQNNFAATYSNRFIGVYTSAEGALYTVNDARQIFQVNSNSYLIPRTDLIAYKNCILTSTGLFIDLSKRAPDAFEKKLLQHINAYTPVFVNQYILSDNSCYIAGRDHVRYLTADRDTLILNKRNINDHCFADGLHFYLFNEKNELEVYEKGKFHHAVKLSGSLEFLRDRELQVFPDITGNIVRCDNKLYKLCVKADSVYMEFLMAAPDKARYRLFNNTADSMQFVSSAKGGFYHIQKQKFKTYVPEGQTWNKETYALIWHKGRVVDNKWFAVKAGMETEISVTRQFYTSILQNDTVLWMRADSNIIRFNAASTVPHSYRPTGDYRVDFYLSPFDKKLYFFSGKEIYLMEDNKRISVLSLQGTNEKEPHIISHFYSPSEWLLGDNLNKLMLYNTTTRTAIHFSEFEHTAIRHIMYDKELGCYWISTYGKGMFILDKRRKPIPLSKDPQGNLSAAHYVLNDRLGYYWIPTNNGLYRMSQSSAKNFIAGNIRVPEFNYYSVQDGLVNNEFNGGYAHSGIRLPNGNLAFASMEGVVEINPKDFRDIKPYRIFIDNIEVDGTRLVNDGKIEVNDNFINFTVSVSSPVFGNPQINFEYNIQELGTYWQPMGADNKIQLSGLQAGNYTLRFRIQDEANPRRYTTLRLNVRGAWYQSTSALVTYGLLIGFFLFGIVFIRANSQKKKALKEFQLAESELKALRSQINPHHFSNALGSIQKYIYQNNMEMAGEYLANFSQLMRLSLDNSESDYITLSDEVAYLKSYVELENRSMKTPFQYHIDTSAVYDTSAILVPSMLVQPFVENAIRHGLSPEQVHDPRLSIAFMYKDKVLQCIITDNGVGMKPIQMDRKISGFIISSNRLHLFGKLLNIPVSITQLPVNHGTSIAITMPYKTNN